MSNEEQNSQNVTENTSTTTQGETKKCKYCQSDIPKKAKVCPVCKRKVKGKAKVIILIIILALVLLSFTMCATMCGATIGNEINKSLKEEEKKEDALKALTKKKFKVGEVVNTDDMEIKYLSVKDYKSDNEFIQPKKGYKYIRAEFEFVNKSEEDDLAVSTFNFSCNADDYDAETVYMDDNELDADLSPGKKTKGPIYFEVPKDAKSIEIQYESDWWDNTKFTFIAK